MSQWLNRWHPQVLVAAATTTAAAVGQEVEVAVGTSWAKPTCTSGVCTQVPQTRTLSSCANRKWPGCTGVEGGGPKVVGARRSKDPRDNLLPARAPIWVAMSQIFGLFIPCEAGVLRLCHNVQASQNTQWTIKKSAAFLHIPLPSISFFRHLEIFFLKSQGLSEWAAVKVGGTVCVPPPTPFQPSSLHSCSSMWVPCRNNLSRSWKELGSRGAHWKSVLYPFVVGWIQTKVCWTHRDKWAASGTPEWAKRERLNFR